MTSLVTSHINLSCHATNLFSQRWLGYYDALACMSWYTMNLRSVASGFGPSDLSKMNMVQLVTHITARRRSSICVSIMYISRGLATVETDLQYQ
jgi:hypothetical protein